MLYIIAWGCWGGFQTWGTEHWGVISL